MAALMDKGTVYGPPLNQLGQPNPNPPQAGFSAPGLSPFWQQISQNPAFSSLFQRGGGPPANPPATGGDSGQAGTWMQNMGPLAGDAGQPMTGASLASNFGQPPSPPAANAMGGAPAGGAPSQTLANPPASGGPFGYGQRSPMMGSSFNAAGFGGLGATGQGPGARYWSRLNNIGGA